MARKRNKSKVDSVDSTGLDDNGKAVLAMLTALEDEDKLNDWEQGFVADMMDRFINQLRPLTPKQFTALENTYRKFN